MGWQAFPEGKLAPEQLQGGAKGSGFRRGEDPHWARAQGTVDGAAEERCAVPHQLSYYGLQPFAGHPPAWAAGRDRDHHGNGLNKDCPHQLGQPIAGCGQPVVGC